MHCEGIFFQNSQGVELHSVKHMHRKRSEVHEKLKLDNTGKRITQVSN